MVYDFHYNYFKAKYGDRATLLFTDTDNLMYEIKTDDAYADISADVEARFDTVIFGRIIRQELRLGSTKRL